jgi:tetratricopeptide (TPR) repeat protein
MPAVHGHPGRSLSKGAVLAPLVTLGLLIVFWRLGQKWLAIPVVAAAALFILLLPRLVRSRLARFHKRSLLLISSGRAAEVPDLARRDLVLQLFGPAAPIDAKIGLALSQTGEHARALAHLEQALPQAPPNERPALHAALVKALFVGGDPARAEAEGLALLDAGFRFPEVLVAVARARVGLSRLDDRTLSLLDEAERSAPGGDVPLMAALTRLEIALATGRKHGDLPPGADSGQRFLRAWVHLVRGRLREDRGDTEAAAESYGKAIRESGDRPCWFALLAHERLERIAGEAATADHSQGPESVSEDPVLKRKRKKRR